MASLNKIKSNGRVELKAIVSSSSLYRLESWIFSKTKLINLFPDRKVNNIYFETHDYLSAKDNLDGISKRTKVRYRWYGSFDNKNYLNGALEFKRKLNNIGWKENHPMLLDDKAFFNYGLLIKSILKNLPSKEQIEFSNYNLPFVLNGYHRKYFATSDKQIRVTVDSLINAYDQRWNFSVMKKNRIILPNIVIVEFKFSQDFKDKAIKLIHDFPFRISKHSKYITSILHA